MSHLRGVLSHSFIYICFPSIDTSAPLLVGVVERNPPVLLSRRVRASCRRVETSPRLLAGRGAKTVLTGQPGCKKCLIKVRYRGSLDYSSNSFQLR